MKAVAVAIFGLSITMLTHAQGTMEDHYDLSRTATIVALDLLQEEATLLTSSGAEYRQPKYDYDIAPPLRAKFTEKEVVDRLCEAIVASHPRAGYLPLLGDVEMCRIALLNREDEVIAIVNIQNTCRCKLFPGHRDDSGRFVQVRNEGRQFEFMSRDLAKAVFTRLRGSSPAYFKRLDERAQEFQGVSAEESLFGKKVGEQDGADQPALAPESKSEGNDKPQPDSEGRSR